MKVYIASLSDYNAGTLMGEWLDLADYTEGDEILEAIGEMLARFDEEHGTAENFGAAREEWAAHDWEDVPDSLASEHPNWDKVMSYVVTAEALSESDLEAFTDWAGNMGYDMGDAEYNLSSFRDEYYGHYASEEAFAEELADEQMPSDAPKFLTDYFDYVAFARDLFIGDFWMSSNGHVFRR